MNSGEAEMAKARSAQLGQQDQQRQQAEQRQQEKDARDEQRRAICRNVLEPEALERLNRIGLVKPEKQVQLEELIFANVSRGAIKQKIDQGTFVNLLQQIERAAESSKAASIQFKRTAFDDDDSDLDLDHLEASIKIDRFKLDAEKSCGLEVELDDPNLKDLQSIIVQEEDFLTQLKAVANEFINSVTMYGKKDLVELRETLNAITDSSDKYLDTTCVETADIGSWVIVELQECILNRIEERLKEHLQTREQFWKLKRMRSTMAKLNKVAPVDIKSKLDLPAVVCEVAATEQQLFDQLANKKQHYKTDIIAVWNEYRRIEAEYFAKMNDAISEEQLSPIAVTINKSNLVRSPVIGGSDEESDS